KPELSAAQLKSPPAVPPFTRGTTSPVAFPVATSNKCTSPVSLPPFDSDTATSLPSKLGTNQSIVVPPLGSSWLGSTNTRAVEGSPGHSTTDKNGCCFGGSVLMKNSLPPMNFSPP